MALVAVLWALTLLAVVAASLTMSREPEGATAMPTISQFHGITIMMFYEDHEPPHFHARHARRAGAKNRRTDVMLATIKAARARPVYTVEIEWGNGSRSVVDFSPTIAKGGIFASLADKDFFVERLSIGGDGDWLSWPGDIDFSADSLWYRSHPEEEVGEVAAGR